MPTNQEKADHVVRSFKLGRQERQAHDERVDLLAPFVDPTRYGITQQNVSEGQALLTNVYDSTGIFAHDLAGNYVWTSIANPGAKWMGLKERRFSLNQDDEVREWMEETRDRMLADRRQGNFYQEGHQVVKDTIGFGNGDALLEEGPIRIGRPKFGYRGTRWKSVKIGRYVVFEDGWGQVNGKIYEQFFDPISAVDRFGRDNVSEAIRAAYDTNSLDKRFVILHAILPRSTQERFIGRGNTRMPWASMYVEMEAKHLIQESGYSEFPGVNPRVNRVPGEKSGRGRGEIALNDLLTLSTAKRLELEGLAFAFKPMWFVANESVFGTINWVPGGQVPVRTNGRSVRDMVHEYTGGNRFDITQIKEEELRRSIREAYFVDHIRELMMIEGRKEMTAFEFGQKLNLLHKLVGPIYTTIEDEMLKKDVSRQFNLMFEGGAFSTPPDILLNEGGQIDVVFENPLARSQRMEDVEAMDRVLARISQIAEMQMKFSGKPRAEILDNFPFDNWARLMSESEGLPATQVLSQKQVAVIRDSFAEQQQQERQAELIQGAAESLGKVAPFVKATKSEKAA